MSNQKNLELGPRHPLYELSSQPGLYSFIPSDNPNSLIPISNRYNQENNLELIGGVAIMLRHESFGPIDAQRDTSHWVSAPKDDEAKQALLDTNKRIMAFTAPAPLNEGLTQFKKRALSQEGKVRHYLQNANNLLIGAEVVYKTPNGYMGGLAISKTLQQEMQCAAQRTKDEYCEDYTLRPQLVGILRALDKYSDNNEALYMQKIDIVTRAIVTEDLPDSTRLRTVLGVSEKQPPPTITALPQAVAA